DKADMERVEPLYGPDDVVRVLERIVSVPYKRALSVADGVRVMFHDAGHVLGSAVTQLDVEEGGTKRRVVFTGDLGRKKMPILKDPELVDGADVLVTESTYGDRRHKPILPIEDHLAAVIKRRPARGG